MTEYVTNRLHFITNTEAILKFIKSKHVHDNPPPEFSFNSIKPMPDELFLPLGEQILSLSLLNMRISPLNETTKQIVLSKITSGAPPGIPSASTIPDKINVIRKSLTEASTDEAGKELFEKAVSNYTRHRFFSHYDWRLVHWGTLADVHTVTESTFHPSSAFIEFTTKWTPPIAAMQILANTFPSVRFKLKYQSHPDVPWMTEDIFAFPPFGY
jgi:hypothetical protein